MTLEYFGSTAMGNFQRRDEKHNLGLDGERFEHREDSEQRRGFVQENPRESVIKFRYIISLINNARCNSHQQKT